MTESGRTPSAPDDFSIDLGGIRLPSSCHAVIDVLFDGRRIWSFAADEHPLDGQHRTVRWPTALRCRLQGSATVTLRRHDTTASLFEREVTFDDHDGRVRIVNGAGRELVIDKAGHEARALDVLDSDSRTSLVDGLARTLRVLNEDCGVPGFMAYGTLLGAVRDGHFIGHDTDMDVAYLSDHTKPVDAALESFRLERIFRRNGWHTVRDSAGLFKVFITESAGTVRHVDIFSSFFCDGLYHLVPFVSTAFSTTGLSRETLLPLGEVELEGRDLPAPADCATLLAATYGEDWKVPNPAFHYELPRSVKRRVAAGWYRNYLAHRRRWVSFYEDGGGDAVPEGPSAFARWTGCREGRDALIVDVGCGTGRDAMWFARHGHGSLGLDYAPPGFGPARATAEHEGLPVSFENFNLYNVRNVLAVGTRLAHDSRPRIVYGRFVVHALEAEARQNLWRLAQLTLRGGGRLYLEFRTPLDSSTEHAFGERYRNYVDPDLVVREIGQRGGRIEYRTEGRGMAPHGNEDPHVCRLVASWSA
ncbi:MAG: methyltransferase domain-containing protein [Pseudonocardiaceae bacterium]|nr:methyltransferase domain-containing protein [Pseudonocardiaceae bacterium]